MKSLVRIIGCIFLLVQFSCTKEEFDAEDGTISDKDEEIRFEVSVASLDGLSEGDATTRFVIMENYISLLEENDTIGIFAVEHGKDLSSPLYIYNKPLTYNNLDWVWIGNSKIYWPNDGTKLDFYAYYPYDKLLTNPENHVKKVMTNQESSYPLEYSNFMFSKSDNNKQGFNKGDVVSFKFASAMSLIEVEAVSATSALNRFIMLDVGYRSSHNIGTGISTTYDGKTNIIMGRYKRGNSYLFRAIVPPHTVEPFFTYTLNGIVYEYKAPEVTLEKGKVHKYKLNINQ